jgi:hypothetical protein
MAKKEYHFPKNIYEFETQLLTYIAMVGVLAGTQSIIYHRLYSWTDHLHTNYLIYDSQAHEKPLWLAKVLYSIDILVQQQLVLLRDPNTPMSQMCWFPIMEGFARRQNEIIDRCLITQISDTLMQVRSTTIKKRKGMYENKDQQNKRTDLNKKDEKSGTQTGTTTQTSSTPEINSKLNPEWKIPADKDFKSCFVTNGLIRETPCTNNTPFCLQFHVRGSCNRGKNCKLSHTDPRDVNMGQTFSTFIKKAFKLASPDSNN